MGNIDVRSGAPSGSRPRRGRLSYFLTGKDQRQTFTLTKLSNRILTAAATRTRRSQSDVVEMLLRQYGSAVDFPDEGRQSTA